MDRASWCYISGRVSALWEHLLDHRALLGLLQADSEDDRRARLRSSLLFAEEPPGDKPVEETERHFEDLVRLIAQASPDARIADLFLLGRKWEAFREFLKNAVLETPASAPQPARTDNAEDEFAAALNAQVQDENMLPFAGAAANVVSDLPREDDRAGWIDRVLDAHEAASLVAAAERLESRDLLNWTRKWVNLRAALALIRARRAGWDALECAAHWRSIGFDDPALARLAREDDTQWPRALRDLGIPHADEALGRHDDTARLARLIDESVAASASAAAGMPFGPERVFAFLWALKCETTNIRLLLSAAALAAPADSIQDQLRTGYA